MNQKLIFKRSFIIFLRGLIVLIGIGVLAFMLWEPQIEGRNANATQFDIYFKDPFLAYAYTASIAFFVALHKSFKVLGYFGKNKTFSTEVVKALRTIKYCAMTIIGFVLPAVAYLFIVRPGDDIAGGVFMGTLITFGSILVATVSAMFEQRIQNAMNVRS